MSLISPEIDPVAQTLYCHEVFLENAVAAKISEFLEEKKLQAHIYTEFISTRKSTEEGWGTAVKEIRKETSKTPNKQYNLNGNLQLKKEKR